MAKDAYYFSHDSNSQDDPKCMILIDQLGMEGYGIFWACVEKMHETNMSITKQELIEKLSLIGFGDPNEISDCIEHMLKSGVFIENNGVLYSERIAHNVADYIKRYVDTGRKGGKKTQQKKKDGWEFEL